MSPKEGGRWSIKRRKLVNVVSLRMVPYLKSKGTYALYLNHKHFLISWNILHEVEVFNFYNPFGWTLLCLYFCCCTLLDIMDLQDVLNFLDSQFKKRIAASLELNKHSIFVNKHSIFVFVGHVGQED